MSELKQEEVRDASSIDDMRAEIFRLQHYELVVGRTMQTANVLGYCGEDRYVLLAYHALKQLAHVKGLLLSDLRTNISPTLITELK